MSRKSTLKQMASLIGNAAAHRALDPQSSFALREALLYEAQAEREAEMHTWNQDEISLFRERAIHIGSNVIKKRTRSHRGRSLQELATAATEAIDEFIAEELQGKRNKYR